MKEIAIIEFWLIVCIFVLLIVLFKICTREHKENLKLKNELLKAKNEADYTKRLMELKEKAYSNVKEKNKKLDEGNKHNRITNAGDVLCND